VLGSSFPSSHCVFLNTFLLFLASSLLYIVLFLLQINVAVIFFIVVHSTLSFSTMHVLIAQRLICHEVGFLLRHP
jgi:hypothetical protein